MTCELFTPHARLFSDEVAFVEAEDATGTFQILPQHCEFFAHLIPGVMRCRTPQGRWHYFAVEGGVLTVAGDKVTVALRDGVEGDSLHDVEEKARTHYGQQRDEEIRTKAALARMRIAVLRKAFEFEKAPE